MKVSAKNGRFVLFFDWMGIECEQDSGLSASPENLQPALDLLKIVKEQIDGGNFNFSDFRSEQREICPPHASPVLQRTGTPTFAQFSEQWFREHQLEWRPAYRAIVKLTIDVCLLPYFGDMPVNKIDKTSILAFRSTLPERPGKGGNLSLSSGRINNIMLPLRMILLDAADRFDFPSPWRRIKSLKHEKNDILPFTLEEAERLIRGVRPDWRDYIEFRLFTGLRSSEVHALRWSSVDLDRRQLHVREAYVAGKVGPCKNSTSNRIVKFPSRVQAALKRQAEHTGHNELVFPAARGGYLNNRWLTDHIWYPALKALKFEKRRPYQMRHTCATLWLAAGESPQWISRQLGHANCEMLFKVYARYVPDAICKDGAAIDMMLESDLSATGKRFELAA